MVYRDRPDDARQDQRHRRLKHIEDAVLPLLKKGHYMEAFEEYAHSSGQLLAYYNDQARLMISPMPFNG